MRPQWAEIEALDNRVERRRRRLAMLLEGRRLVERGNALAAAQPRAGRSTSPRPSHYFAAGAAALYEAVPRLLGARDAEPLAGARRRARAGRRARPSWRARVASLATMFSAFDIVEVADETGLDVEQVAAVHFRLGSALQLHWLRDRIVALPRDDRWGALARAALRDDLYSLHRALTAEVLRQARRTATRSSAWRPGSTANPAVRALPATLADIRVGHVFDMTTLPVAVREVRNLLESRP